MSPTPTCSVFSIKSGTYNIQNVNGGRVKFNISGPKHFDIPEDIRNCCYWNFEQKKNLLEELNGLGRFWGEKWTIGASGQDGDDEYSMISVKETLLEMFFMEMWRY